MTLTNPARNLCLLAAAVLIVVGYAPSANGIVINTPPSPQCSDEAHRQLDFWRGDWDAFEMTAPDGPVIGLARIESVAGGCALHELYWQKDGLVGDSLLNYDAAEKRWNRKWVTNRGSSMILRGPFADDALAVEGEVHLHDGGTELQRISLRQVDGGVRETALASQDGGRTWSPEFDVLFVKRAVE